MYYLNDKGLYISWVLFLIVGVLIGMFMFNMYLKNTNSNVGVETRQYEYYRGMYEFCISIAANFGIDVQDAVVTCRDSIAGALSVDRFSADDVGWERGVWLGFDGN